MFREPQNLLLLLVTGVWVTLLVRSFLDDLARKRLLFSSRPMFERIVGHKPTRRPFIKAVMAVVALLLLGIAIARPVGDQTEENVFGQGLDLVVGLDVSQSMKAPDIEGNPRLEVAKALVTRLMYGLRQDRVGLVVFAGDTMVQCPLTLDKNAFLTYLERVDSGLLTKQGTNLAQAIETCIDRFDFTASQSKVIVLISDGEDQNKDRLDRAIQEAKRKGIPIFTLGIGSREGGYIPEGRDMWGEYRYKTFKGERVVTKLDDKVLRKIAKETGAKYFRASDIASAKEVAVSLEGLKRVSIKAGTQMITRELFFLPVLAAFLILLIEWMISERIPYEREKDHWLKRI